MAVTVSPWLSHARAAQEAGIAAAGDEDPGVLLVRSVRHGAIFRVFRGDRGYPESIAGGQFSTLAVLLKSADL